jgi:hypothetical protein
VQVDGSGLIYQWEISKDGGATWVMIRDSNSAVLEVSRVGKADSGAIFRCLVSSAAGSVASEAAKLTVNAATSTVKSQL